ncbi:hypothetical protein D9M71_748300 [compost metagenome]
MQRAALQRERSARLDGHALAIQCAGAGGFRVLLGVAVTAPEVLAVTHLLFDTLAVEAGDDVQVAAAVDVQVSPRVHACSAQVHVAAGLQQYAFLGLHAGMEQHAQC